MGKKRKGKRGKYRTKNKQNEKQKTSKFEPYMLLVKNA